MLSARVLLLAFSISGALAAPTTLTSSEDVKTVNRRYVTPSSQGTNNGFFYSMWSDNTGDVEYNNGAAGQYSLTWTNSNDVVVGKGFNPGAPRNITYNADYEPNGISFLSVYGWFTDPLTEYYICENWGTGNPAGGDGMVRKGQFESDGSTYDVYEHQQVNAPSIQGTTNFMQYWSIRQDRRTSGTIDTANHYNYWKSIGLPIGTFGYQILATEGVKSSGKSSVTISEGGSDAGSNAGSSSAPAAAAPTTVSSLKPASSAAPVASSAPYSAPAIPHSTAAAVASSSAPTVASASVVPAASPATSYASSSSSVESVVTPPSTVAPAASQKSCTAHDEAAPSVNAQAAPSAASGLPKFGGQTPGAGFPFGSGKSVRYHTPGATPTPHFGHHGGHHLHHGGDAYKGGMSKPAGADSAPSATASPY